MNALRHTTAEGVVREARVVRGPGSRPASAPFGDPVTIKGARGGSGQRVGVFWSYLCGGGVETVNRDLAEGLPRDKYILDAYVWQALPQFLGMAESFDSLTVLNDHFEDFAPQERLGPFTPIARCSNFQRTIEAQWYDAFIVSCCWAPFWLIHMHGIPIIEWWHGYGLWNDWDMPSQAIVAVSESTKRQIELFRPNHAPLTVIRNAIHTANYLDARRHWREARQRFGLQPNGPVMLYCGRFSGEKRPEDAMKAFVLAREHLPDLQLLLVGTCLAPDYFVKLARDLGCRWGVDTWHYTLPHEEIYLAYAAADVMVHPSEWEGLGMVLLEGMAAGLPIVSTFAGGCAEVLEGIGAPVGVGDCEGMAREVVRFLTDGLLWERTSEAGKRRVTQEFELSDQSARVDALLQQVITPRPAPWTAGEHKARELRARQAAVGRAAS